MSSVMDTLSCWSLLLTSLEQQMLTELRTCQELYSTKERLSMTNIPSVPLFKRLASFLGSITLCGSLSPAMVDWSLPQQVGKGKEHPGKRSQLRYPKSEGGGGRGKATWKQPTFATLLKPCMTSHCAKPVRKCKEKEKKRRKKWSDIASMPYWYWYILL